MVVLAVLGSDLERLAREGPIGMESSGWGIKQMSFPRAADIFAGLSCSDAILSISRRRVEFKNG